jgi:hypothetical protein
MKTCLQVLLLSVVYGIAHSWISPPPTTRAVKPCSSTATSLRMGVSSAVKRVRDSILNKERSREDLKIGIAGFYDRSSKLWEEVWGEVSQCRGGGRRRGC